MDFCAKIKLRMTKLLDTKHNWLLKVFHKTWYWFVKRRILWYWMQQHCNIWLF